MNGHWKKQFNYEYLGSYSLEGDREKVVTIKGVSTEKVTGQSGRKEDCFTVSFKEFDKPMILNRTNSKAIEKVASSPLIEEWIGVQVSLYVQPGVRAFGDVVDALRIRDTKPTKEKLTKDALSAMQEALKLGKVKQVEMAVPKYNMTKEQQAILTKSIEEAKVK